MKEQHSELFFVEIRNPSDVRKNILEILRGILEMLQKFEKFKSMRHEKLGNINKLRILLKDANKMMGELKSRLPQTSIRAPAIKAAKPHLRKQEQKDRKKPKPSEEKAAPKKEMTELERLESELKSIEGKLKSLT